jgi:hypothetical protein
MNPRAMEGVFSHGSPSLIRVALHLTIIVQNSMTKV